MIAMIRSDEEWVSLCRVDDNGAICFTDEYLALTNTVSGCPRKLASHLIAHWTPEFGTLLDYFGPPDEEEDRFSGIDGEPMDVKEDVTDLWEYYDIPFKGLDGEFYRDILRAKLISMKLPKRLINKYVATAKKNLNGDL